MYKGATEPLTYVTYPIVFTQTTRIPCISTHYGEQASNPITCAGCTQPTRARFGFVVFIGNGRVVSDTSVAITYITTGV